MRLLPHCGARCDHRLRAQSDHCENSVAATRKYEVGTERIGANRTMQQK